MKEIEELEKNQAIDWSSYAQKINLVPAFSGPEAIKVEDKLLTPVRQFPPRAPPKSHRTSPGREPVAKLPVTQLLQTPTAGSQKASSFRGPAHSVVEGSERVLSPNIKRRSESLSGYRSEGGKDTMKRIMKEQKERQMR